MNYEIYRAQADVILEVVKHSYFGYYSGEKFHADHKYSVFRGAKNDIPLEIISARHNLELLTAEENMDKSWRCSITKDELHRKYVPDDKLTKFCQFIAQQEDIDVLLRWKQIAHDRRVLEQKEMFREHSRNRRKARMEMKIIDALPCLEAPQVCQ